MSKREYKGNRDDDMIGDAIGELQGKVIKGTITSANAGKDNHWYNNVEKVIPEAAGGQWYVKKEVIGMPSYNGQKGKGSPRVIVLVDGAVPQNEAWFTDHYNKFHLLADARFMTRAKTMRDFFSK
jgi:hypothetical protein